MNSNACTSVETKLPKSMEGDDSPQESVARSIPILRPKDLATAGGGDCETVSDVGGRDGEDDRHTDQLPALSLSSSSPRPSMPQPFSTLSSSSHLVELNLLDPLWALEAFLLQEIQRELLSSSSRRRRHRRHRCCGSGCHQGSHSQWPSSNQREKHHRDADIESEWRELRREAKRLRKEKRARGYVADESDVEGRRVSFRRGATRTDETKLEADDEEEEERGCSLSQNVPLLKRKERRDEKECDCTTNRQHPSQEPGVHKRGIFPNVPKRRRTYSARNGIADGQRQKTQRAVTPQCSRQTLQTQARQRHCRHRNTHAQSETDNSSNFAGPPDDGRVLSVTPILHGDSAKSALIHPDIDLSRVRHVKASQLQPAGFSGDSQTPPTFWPGQIGGGDDLAVPKVANTTETSKCDASSSPSFLFGSSGVSLAPYKQGIAGAFSSPFSENDVGSERSRTTTPLPLPSDVVPSFACVDGPDDGRGRVGPSLVPPPSNLYMSYTVSLDEALAISGRARMVIEADPPHKVAHFNAAYECLASYVCGQESDRRRAPPLVVGHPLLNVDVAKKTETEENAGTTADAVVHSDAIPAGLMFDRLRDGHAVLDLIRSAVPGAVHLEKSVDATSVGATATNVAMVRTAAVRVAVMVHPIRSDGAPSGRRPLRAVNDAPAYAGTALRGEKNKTTHYLVEIIPTDGTEPSENGYFARTSTTVTVTNGQESTTRGMESEQRRISSGSISNDSSSELSILRAAHTVG